MEKKLKTKNAKQYIEKLQKYKSFKKEKFSFPLFFCFKKEKICTHKKEKILHFPK
jgi:hypothetical protein